MVQSPTHPDTGLSRRRLLQGTALAGSLGVAGCLGFFRSDDSIADLEAAYERQSVDVDDIRTGGSLQVALLENISTFDPVHVPDSVSMLAQAFFFEELLRTDHDGNLYPWLATSYDLLETQDIDYDAYEPYMVELDHVEGAPDTASQIVVSHPENEPNAETGLYLTVDETGDAVDDDVFGMQFRYDLHEGVTFTNGEELTAEHVVRSYERYEHSGMAGQVFNQFLHAEAVDEYTVDLFAQVPDAEAERDLSMPVFAAEQRDLSPGELDPTNGHEPIGTGPYVFEAFEDGEYLTVRRNEDYWFDLGAKSWWDGPEGWPDGPVIDEVHLEIIADSATRSAALQRGEVDVASSLAPETLVEYQASDDFRVTATPGGTYTFLQFPVRVEPWDTVELRRAVNHLIPREDIVDNVLAGWGEPAWAPLPRMAAEAGTRDYEQLIETLRPQNAYDPERADELIEEADVDTPIEVTIECNAEAQTVRLVEVLQNSLNQSDHFDVAVDTYEWTTFVTRVMNPTYYQEGKLTVLGLSGTFNPQTFVEATHHPDQFAQCCNFQNIGNDDLTALMADAQFGMDVLDDNAERARRYDGLWEQVVAYNANSYVSLGVEELVHATEVVGLNAYPFPEHALLYGLYAPMDEQITYLDR